MEGVGHAAAVRPKGTGGGAMRGINIQLGHIARHTPRNAGAQGREAQWSMWRKISSSSTCTKRVNSTS